MTPKSPKGDLNAGAKKDKYGCLTSPFRGPGGRDFHVKERGLECMSCLKNNTGFNFPLQGARGYSATPDQHQ